MRILIFTAYYLPHIGGYITDTHTLARGLIAKGHKVEIVTCNTEKSAQEEIIDKVRVVRLPCWNLLGGQYPIPKPSRVLVRLLGHYPDVISTQTRFFVMSFVGVLLAKIKKVPLIHTERGAMHSVVGSRLVNLISKVYDHTLGSLVVSRSDLCIGVSNASCDFMEHLGAKKMVRIPLGIGYNFFRLKARGKEKKVIFTGRLVYGKGVQDLIVAFGLVRRSIPDAQLVIVGDGDYLPKLKELATPSVNFTGAVSHKEVVRLLAEADIFVNPSYSEGLPSSVAEAMAVGLPVIAYNVGGTSELIQQGVNGYLVNFKNISGLAVRITELLENEKIAKRMGERGRQKIRGEYQWSKVIDAYDLILASIR